MVDTHTLHGKIVLIPGASRSIGRHIARKFGEKGATLLLPWLDWPDSVEEMVDEFSQKQFTFYDCRCDLRNRDEVKELANDIKSRFGSVHYLINNIERGGMPVVHGTYDHDHNREQWDLEFSTTLKAKWNLYHFFSPLLQQAGKGCVINISSIAAHTGRSGPAAYFFNDGYSAANRAIQTLTETWARESAPSVRVNEIMLGLVRSRHGENTRGWSILTEKQKEALYKRILLERTANESEVAELTYFLAVQATYMTGEVVRMDGGYLLGGDEVPPMPPGILEE